MMAAEDPSTPPAPPTSLVGAALAGGRYLIEDEIAVGGMGEVYRARDMQWSRHVAIKRIAPRLSADPEALERFRKEAERTFSLNDPHIAVLHDVLAEEGQLFLVMELVAGMTLRQRLSRLDGKPFDLKESLSIGIQCARALRSAHKQRVLHCDLKPENIMILPNGDVKILDFGLARALPRRASSEDSTQEMPSRPLASAGTPAYMSPESLRGDEMDERTDLYSLGVVLYEAVTGRNPFAGVSYKAVERRVLDERPAPARSIRPGLPVVFSRFLDRLMAKDPSERWNHADDVVEGLRRIRAEIISGHLARVRSMALATFVVGVLGLTTAFFPPIRDAFGKFLGIIPRLPEQKRVAVLPFREIGQDAGQRAFRDGLMVVVASRLGSLEPYDRAFDIVSSSEVLSNNVNDVQSARKKLGATLAVTGTVQHTELGLRVTAELVEPRNGRVIRTMPPIDRSPTESALLQDLVAVGVARMLEPELREHADRLLRVGRTANPRANDAYLRALGHMASYDNPQSRARAREGFVEATQLDPSFAYAWAGLAELDWREYELSSARPWLDAARAAAERAVAIDPELPEAHVGLGYTHMGTGNYELAADEYRRAIELDPANSDAYRGLASAYQALGRPDEAEAAFREAIRKYPQFWAGYNWLGSFLLREGRYEEAIAQFKRVTEISPTNPRGYLNLGAAYEYAGNKTEAARALEKSIDILPTHTAYHNLGGFYMYARDYRKASAMYESAIDLNPNFYRSWGFLADCCRHLPNDSARADSAYRMANRVARQQLETNARDPELLIRIAGYECRLGRTMEARRLLEQALRTSKTTSDTRFLALMLFEELGDRNRAFELLRSVMAEGYSVEEVMSAPQLDELRKDPRFRRIVNAAS